VGCETRDYTIATIDGLAGSATWDEFVFSLRGAKRHQVRGAIPCEDCDESSLGFFAIIRMVAHSKQGAVEHGDFYVANYDSQNALFSELSSSGRVRIHSAGRSIMMAGALTNLSMFAEFDLYCD
jgi:hypothetical protein